MTPLDFWLMAFCSVIFITNITIEILDKDLTKGERLYRGLADLTLFILMTIVFVKIVTKG